MTVQNSSPGAVPVPSPENPELPRFPPGFSPDLDCLYAEIISQDWPVRAALLCRKYSAIVHSAGKENFGSQSEDAFDLDPFEIWQIIMTLVLEQIAPAEIDGPELAMLLSLSQHSEWNRAGEMWAKAHNEDFAAFFDMNPDYREIFDAASAAANKYDRSIN